MRYFASASAHAGYSRSSLWPLKWKSPISGTRTPSGRGDRGSEPPRRRLRSVDRDAHQLGARARERLHLLCGALDVRGVGIGHRLHDDGCAAADLTGRSDLTAERSLMLRGAAHIRYLGGAGQLPSLGRIRAGMLSSPLACKQSVRRESGALAGTPKAQVSARKRSGNRTADSASLTSRRALESGAPLLM